MAMKGRRPWAPSRPMAMGCMTWRAMCGNGRRTGTRNVIQQTRPRPAASRSIPEGGQWSRVLILHYRRSAFQERCSKVAPSSARLITACVIARRHVFPRRLIPLRAISASGVLSISLPIIDHIRIAFLPSTITLSAETPWPQGAGVLPSFQLSLPCDRAESATKRTLSRPTRTVQDMTVGSAKSLPFRRLILLVATYAHLQALLLSSQRREERGSPALGFIALRSYGALLEQVYDCCQYLQMKRAKKGTLFIPCI